VSTRSLVVALAFGVFVSGSAQAFLSVSLYQPKYAPIGSTLGVTVQVTSTTGSIVRPITVTYDMPAATTFRAITSKNATAMCTTPAVGSSGTITCTIAQPTSSDLFLLASDVPPAMTAGTVLTMSASASQAGETTANATATSEAQPAPVGALDVVAPPAVIPGSPYHLTVTATNTDTVTRNYMVFNNINDPVHGFTYTSVTQLSGPTATRYVSAPYWYCNVALAPGESASFDVAAFATDYVFMPASGIHTYLLASDFNMTVASVTSIIGGTVTTDFAVTGTAPRTVNVGDDVVFTVTVTNVSPQRGSVDLYWSVPANTRFISADFPCLPYDGNTQVGCSFLNASATETVRFRMLATSAGTITNSAHIIARSFPDSNASNDMTTATTTVSAIPQTADLSVTMTPAAPSIDANKGAASWNIVILNLGPSAPGASTLTFTPPAGTTTIDTGDISCSGTTPAVCTLPTLSAGVTLSRTFTTHGPTPPGATLSATAAVASETPDPISDNNSASESVIVNAVHHRAAHH